MNMYISRKKKLNFKLILKHVNAFRIYTFLFIFIDSTKRYKIL